MASVTHLAQSEDRAELSCQVGVFVSPTMKKCHGKVSVFGAPTDIGGFCLSLSGAHWACDPGLGWGSKERSF